jgi:hypothetical protein
MTDADRQSAVEAELTELRLAFLDIPPICRLLSVCLNDGVATLRLALDDGRLGQHVTRDRRVVEQVRKAQATGWAPRYVRRSTRYLQLVWDTPLRPS